MLINGKEMNFKPGVTITEILKELKLSSELVVVEVNFEIISKENYSTRTLNERDRVEIICFIGGG